MLPSILVQEIHHNSDPLNLYDLSNPTNASVLLSSWTAPGGNDNNFGLSSVAFGGNRR